MKRHLYQILPIAVILAIATAAIAADKSPTPAPKRPDTTKTAPQSITGPTEAEPGDLVILTAEPEAKGYKWAQIPDTGKWLEIEGGRRVVFATGKAGNYVFVLATATADCPCLYQHAVKIGTPTPTPDPAPAPDPTPDPEPTPEPTGLEAIAYSNAAKIDSGTRQATAEAIAAAFDAVAAKIADKSLTNRQRIQTETAQAVAKAAGANAAAWDQTLAAIEAHLDAESAAGRLVTLTEYRAAWAQIAAGIRRAAK